MDMGIGEDGSMTSDFGAFYEQVRDRVFRAVVVATGDRNAADDAVEEAFVRACERWRKVQKHPSPVAGVVTVALNEHRSSLRRRRRAAAWHQAEILPPEALELFDPSLLKAIRELPERQRQVLALRVLLDLSTQQTADALGIAAGTVTAHLHRALESLRESLTDEKEAQL